VVVTNPPKRFAVHEYKKTIRFKIKIPNIYFSSCAYWF